MQRFEARGSLPGLLIGNILGLTHLRGESGQIDTKNWLENIHGNYASQTEARKLLASREQKTIHFTFLFDRLTTYYPRVSPRGSSKQGCTFPIDI
jgi:hypothetical protein